MLSLKQTKNDCGPGRVLETMTSAARAESSVASSPVNSEGGVGKLGGGVPTQVMTRGRGVLLFYRRDCQHIFL